MSGFRQPTEARLVTSRATRSSRRAKGLTGPALGQAPRHPGQRTVPTCAQVRRPHPAPRSRSPVGALPTGSGSYNRCDARSSGPRVRRRRSRPCRLRRSPVEPGHRHERSQFVGDTHAFVAGGSVAGVASSISATSMSTAQPSGISSLEVAQAEGSASGATLFAWRWLFPCSSEVEVPEDGLLSEADEQAAEPITVHRIKTAEAAAVRVRMRVPPTRTRSVRPISRSTMPPCVVRLAWKA